LKICIRHAVDVVTDNRLQNVQTEVNIAWKIVLSSGVPIREWTVAVGKKKILAFSFSNSSRCVYSN
jgi:hypothetical protein